MIRLAVRCEPEYAEHVLANLLELAPNGVEEERHFLNPTEPSKVPDAKEVAPGSPGIKDDSLVSSVTRALSAAPPSPHP